MPELQQYEYRDLINVRKEILNRFQWVITEIEQTIENLETRRLSVTDAQQRIDQPLVKEVCCRITLIYIYIIIFIVYMILLRKENRPRIRFIKKLNVYHLLGN